MASKRTMTLQTQTPGGQKPPTLAKLQRLCERKGQVLVMDGEYVIKLCEQRTWWLKVVFGPLNILTGGTPGREGARAKRGLTAQAGWAYSDGHESDDMDASGNQPCADSCNRSGAILVRFPGVSGHHRKPNRLRG